jgi:heterodisulfide reductase subunit C
MVKKMVMKLPLSLMTKMGMATVFRPRTRNWGPAREAIREYVAEQKQREKAALGLNDLVAQAAADARNASAKQESTHV